MCYEYVSLRAVPHGPDLGLFRAVTWGISEMKDRRTALGRGSLSSFPQFGGDSLGFHLGGSPGDLDCSADSGPVVYYA